MRRFCAVILSLILAWGDTDLQAADALLTTGGTDRSVVPGKRVGAITGYSSLSILQALYGKASVAPKMHPLPSGDTQAGVRLFAGTDHQLDLLWDEDARGKRITEVRIVGSAWTLDNGLKTGLTVAEAEKLIGKPLKPTAPDGEKGTMATIDGTVPGAEFGVVVVTPAPSDVPKRTPTKAKKTAPKPKPKAAPPPAPEPPSANPNAKVAKIVIWFR